MLLASLVFIPYITSPKCKNQGKMHVLKIIVVGVQTWVSFSAPHHCLRKSAQVFSGPACLSGSSMSCDHIQCRLHLLFSMHREPAHSGPSEPQETRPSPTIARSLPRHQDPCGVALAKALVLDPWSLLQPLQCE